MDGSLELLGMFHPPKEKKGANIARANEINLSYFLVSWNEHEMIDWENRINWSIDPVNQPVSQSINQWTTQSINQSSNQSISRSIDQSIKQGKQPINPSIHQTINRIVIVHPHQQVNLQKSLNASILPCFCAWIFLANPTSAYPGHQDYALQGQVGWLEDWCHECPAIHVNQGHSTAQNYDDCNCWFLCVRCFWVGSS